MHNPKLYTGVRRAEDAPEWETDERCAIMEVGNDDGDPDLSIARARVRPGVTTAWHQLVDTDERYLIISGQGVAEVGDTLSEVVGPGDVVRIPAGIAQRITNTSQADLVFYALCVPRFQPGCYQSLE